MWSVSPAAIASVQGRRLGSSIDPMLHLLDPDGTQVAFTHDGLGRKPSRRHDWRDVIDLDTAGHPITP